MKIRNKGKKWTKADDEYLSDAWGKASVKWMASTLGRTEKSVRNRAWALGLGRYIDADSVMTFYQLLEALGIPKNTYTHYKSKLLKAGLPIYKKKIHQRSTYKIKINDFWKWAELNRELINWSKLEENLLGQEPAWVKERRKVDYYNYNNFHKEWTLNDDDALTRCVEKGLSVREIAIKTGRSEGAIRLRCNELFLSATTIRIPQRWTMEETLLAIKLKEQGYSKKAIAAKLGRSEDSIVGRIRYYKRKAVS